MKPGNRRCDARCQFLLVLSGTREMKTELCIYSDYILFRPEDFVTAKVALAGWGS